MPNSLSPLKQACNRSLFEAMRPHLQESVNVNNLGDEVPGRVQAAYGDNCLSGLTAVEANTHDDVCVLDVVRVIVGGVDAPGRLVGYTPAT
jgi:hypothetical protein